ncbi:MAG: hypothetical protein ACYCXY_07550 [Acidimicrobiales bacterium]
MATRTGLRSHVSRTSAWHVAVAAVLAAGAAIAAAPPAGAAAAAPRLHPLGTSHHHATHVRAAPLRSVTLGACLADALTAGAASPTSRARAAVAVRTAVALPVTVGGTAHVRASYTCIGTGGEVPIVGLRVHVTADPAGVVRLSGTTRVTNAHGVVAYTARALGPGNVVLDVHGIGLCRLSRSGACTVRLRLVTTGRAARGVHAPRRLGLIPPSNPAGNAPALDVVPRSCDAPAPAAPAPGQPAPAFGSAPGCTAFYLRRIDAARASEGVGPMLLPTDWTRLTAAEQLFVLADLERVDRGLPPYVGLSASLDAVAQQGADAGADPSLGFPLVDAAASTWAGDAPSALAADYEWVYDDGYGSGNYACSSPGASGCWGHRDGILGEFTGIGCTDCVMGAGAASPTSGPWRTSLTEIFAAPARPGAIPTFFTWQHDVLPYLRAVRSG